MRLLSRDAGSSLEATKQAELQIPKRMNTFFLCVPASNLMQPETLKRLAPSFGVFDAPLPPKKTSAAGHA